MTKLQTTAPADTRFETNIVSRTGDYHKTARTSRHSATHTTVPEQHMLLPEDILFTPHANAHQRVDFGSKCTIGWLKC